jgi:hypothetical protein
MCAGVWQNTSSDSLGSSFDEPKKWAGIGRDELIKRAWPWRVFDLGALAGDLAPSCLGGRGRTAHVELLRELTPEVARSLGSTLEATSRPGHVPRGLHSVGGPPPCFWNCKRASPGRSTSSRLPARLEIAPGRSSPGPRTVVADPSSTASGRVDGAPTHQQQPQAGAATRKLGTERQSQRAEQLVRSPSQLRNLQAVPNAHTAHVPQYWRSHASRRTPPASRLATGWVS